MSHLLVLENDRCLDIAAVGRDVAEALRRPLADVTRALRGDRGILSLGVDGPQAAVVAEVLGARGFRARVVPVGEIPPLPPAEPLTDGDPTPDGLDLQAVAGAPAGLLPWSRLRLAAVGLVTFKYDPAGPLTETGESTSRGIAAAALGGLLGLEGLAVAALAAETPAPRKRRAAPREEQVHCLDLLTDGPPARYRVVASRFIYDYLGSRLGLTSMVNFRRLVMDIARLAPDALLSGSTLSFLENAEPGTHRFVSQEDFDAYLRWLLAWPKVWGEE